MQDIKEKQIVQTSNAIRDIDVSQITLEEPHFTSKVSSQKVNSLFDYRLSYERISPYYSNKKGSSDISSDKVKIR